MNSEITLTRAAPDDAAAFAAMEQADDTIEFIVPQTESEHREKMDDPRLLYLKILHGPIVAGFFILGLEPDGRSVEFRRIVVAEKGQGIGQAAITAMEAFCRRQLERSRIWLDVFEHNARGRHIYEKLGYRRCGESWSDGRTLFIYSKGLDSQDV